MDAVANFSYTTVTVAPSPAASGTALTVADPTVLPAPPFNAVVWPAGAPLPLATQAEIVRVTANASGALTVVRDVEPGGITRSIRVGDQFMAAITAALLRQIAEEEGSTLPVATKTSAYTVQPADRVLLLDATSAPFALTLGAAAGWLSKLELVAITAGTNVVTVNAPGAVKVNRKASITLGSPSSGAEFQSASLVSDQTNYWSV